MMNYLEKKKKAMLNYVSGITPPLPSEYQQVEWIESSGTQYIDSGVLLSSDYGFDIKFLTTNYIGSGGNYGCVFGGRNGSRDYQLTTFAYGNNKGTLRWGNSNTLALNAGITLGVEQNCKCTNAVFTNCLGDDYAITDSALQTIRSAYLFGLNNNGSFAQSGSGCRIYYLKFYDDTNTLIRDFIPCYRKSDNEIGMYDTVNDTFYTNQGSGTFTKGGDV